MSASTQEQERLNMCKSEIQQLLEKTTEMELERDEHQIVLDAMRPMSPERKCFRQVCGTLIEQTVVEAIPFLESQLKGISTAIAQLVAQKELKQEELKKYSQQASSKSQ